MDKLVFRCTLVTSKGAVAHCNQLITVHISFLLLAHKRNYDEIKKNGRKKEDHADLLFTMEDLCCLSLLTFL